MNFAVVLFLLVACLLTFMNFKDEFSKTVAQATKIMQYTQYNQTELKISDVELLEQRQRQRQQQCKKYCERYASNNTKLDIGRKDLRYIIVNDKYKVLYCFIPKVACSQWNRVFLALDNRTNVKNTHLPGYYKFLSLYSEEGIKLRLRAYFKFLFVRDPFERMLSAFENKFVAKRWKAGLVRHYSKEIVDNFKRVHPNSDDNVTFTKFIYYVASVGFNKESHWKTYYKLCHPCDIHYDFIGRFDHMPEEAAYLLRQTGMDQVATFPEFLTHNTTNKMFGNYAQIPKAKIFELAEAFRQDLEMFGYGFPGSLSDVMRDEN